MHSVFGLPSDNHELFASGARAMAAEWLTPLPSVLIHNGAPVESLQAVMTSLWQEFALPKLQNSPSPEGFFCWDSLKTINDSLRIEVDETFSYNMTCKLNYDRDKTEMLQASRLFFLSTLKSVLSDLWLRH